MSTAREEILNRIRTAVLQQEVLSAFPAGGPAAVGRAATPAEVDAAYAALPRDYRRAHHKATTINIVALFAERAADYRAVVERVPETGLPAAIARVLADLPTLMVPGRSPAAVASPASQPAPRTEKTATDPADRPPTGRIVVDDPPLSARELDAVAGVITGCAAAIAETGTIILDHGPGQGRRALTLVPDFHLVVVLAEGGGRPARRHRPARPGPPPHLHLRPVGHQRHRAHPGRGRARAEESAHPGCGLTRRRRRFS